MYTSLCFIQTTNMFLKVVMFSAQFFFIKTVLGQCIGSIGNSYGIGNYEGFLGYGNGFLNPGGCANAQLPRPQLTIPDCGIVSASYGGSLIVEASSPIAPGSISVLSENQIQGPLSVYGTLPFLSAVAFESSLPTLGSGAVNYQIGDGRVTILQENTPASGYDNFAFGSFGEGYNTLGAGWGLTGSSIHGFNNCVHSVPNVYGPGSGYGLNYNKGVNCGCGF